MPIKLVAGLGNPGTRYQHTRHNIGAELVHLLAKEKQLELRQCARFHGQTAALTGPEHKVHLLVPSTYMNESGISIQALLRYYRLPPEAMLVVYDELDLSPGAVKLKYGGGTAGHRGLGSIVQHLGGFSDFWRLRIGVGHPRRHPRLQNMNVKDYLLKPASKEEQAHLDAAVQAAIEQSDRLLTGQWREVMNCLHSRPVLEQDRTDTDSH